jgi:RNA polymerase sigma-70 factor (ECF subfamily)
LEEQADIALIAACQQGDAKAFQQVFDLYKDRVYSLCRHMSGNAEDAEDLTQDVFIRAFKSIGSFRAESSFGTWIHRIAVNRCSTELRKHRPAFDSFESMEEKGGSLPSRIPSPEDQLVRKEIGDRVKAAIADLPENLRLLFILSTVEGLRYREVADIAGCSVDAAKMRIHRARKRVRETLSPYLNA